jgi:chemotaxis protein MotB
MITLLMALFMVLFSISSVNISKFRTLQQALHAAFSGHILPGGSAVAQPGSQDTSHHDTATTAIQTIVPLTPRVATPTNKRAAQALRARAEQSDFLHLKQLLDAYAMAHGFADQVHTAVEHRGLVVRVLTDKVLFASGQAELLPLGMPLLNEIADLLNVDHRHPILVEGHTDDQPIHSYLFPSNWELSTARATTVVRFLIGRSIARRRLGAAGYADLHPIASNATDAGRARNRRVEIVLQRLFDAPQG